MDIYTTEVYAHLGDDTAFLDNQWTYYPGILSAADYPGIFIHIYHTERNPVSVFSVLSKQIHGYFLILKYITIYVPSVSKSV